MRCIISFDFDGVLARSPFGRAVLFPALEGMAGEYALMRGLDAAAAFEELKALLRREALREEAAGRTLGAYDWDSILARLARRLRLSPPDDLTASTRAACRELAASGGGRALLYPAVRETLSALRRRGAYLILLTNGFARYQLPFIELFGLSACFDDVFTSDRLGSVKPSRKAFSLAFGSAPSPAPPGVGGAPEGQRYHVGDRLVQDVAGAKRAGITAVWIHYELPAELKRLAPAERAGKAALRPVLREQLRFEGQAGKLKTEYFPDIVIAGLNEIEPLLLPDCGDGPYR